MKSEARRQAENLVSERGFDWYGYDGENLVSAVACGDDPDLFREVLKIYHENGRSVAGEVNEGDNDSITAFELVRRKPQFQLVLEEFGVEAFRPCRPRVHGILDDGYDAYVESVEDGRWVLRNLVADVAELAYEMHKRDTAPREDSGLPYITHPARVVEMLRSWGYQDGVEPLIVALGWAHDLKEDTRVTDEQIVKAGGPFGERLLAGVNALTFETFSESRAASESDEEHQARKAEYIRHVAEGELDFLVVKIADRICNTMERAETDLVRARGYLKKGEALFARIGELKHGDRVRKTLEEIRARVGG